MDDLDLYSLDPQLVEPPPTDLRGQLKRLGPGFVLSASIVGSGELIATTTLGAKVGYATLWVILISCVVKVALQLEFGRHTIQTGQGCLESFNRLPGWRIGHAHWSIWCWLLIQPVKILQVGGIVGGVGQVMHIIFPQLSVSIWCVVMALVVATLVSWKGYRFIERTSLWLLTAFTTLTLVCVVMLQWTDYAISAQDLLSGLELQLPSGSLLFVVGAFGLTGVGGDEIMQYTYWLIEKGYASKTGACEPNNPEWQRRARGWIRIMYLDAFLSMVVYTVVTAAFYLLGAAVLHARDEVPAGFAMIETLSGIYTQSLGSWANGIFLAGAFVVLFSTLFAALAAWTRTFTDAAAQIGLIDFHNVRSRKRTISLLAWAFPTMWTVLALTYEDPVFMVLVGGVGTALLLLLVVYGALEFRYRSPLPALKPGVLYDGALWLSIVVIVAVAAYTVSQGVQEVRKPAETIQVTAGE